MKLQKKIITLASAAAGLAITIAVAALAAGGFDASPSPDLLAQPQPSQDSLQTPEPVLREEATVYFTEQGHYFHFDEHCSGMMNARPHSIQEALEKAKDACPVCVPAEIAYQYIDYIYYSEDADYFHRMEYCGGVRYPLKTEAANASISASENSPVKSPCPVCLPDGVRINGEWVSPIWANPETSEAPRLMQAEETNPELVSSSDMPFYPEETPVYITENGIYAHHDSICCGISGAQPCAYADAHALGYISCPVCGPNPRETVYATESGKYYHCVENCSGMQRALSITPVEAQWEGKWACPVCMVPYVYELEMEGSIRSSAYLQRLIPDTNSGLVLNDFVYTVLGENCFHLDADCSSSPKEHETLELAIARNQLPCPECIGSLPKDYDLFETAFGQDLDALWENWRYSHCYLDDLKAGCYSWIFTNGRDTSPACSVFDRRATDNYQLDIYFKSQKDSLRFLESVTAEPFSHIYPLAMEMARQHLQDTGRYEERENLYADALTILFDKNRQVSDSIMHFKAFEEPFTIEFRILENGKFESSIRS